jgi:hypothetical protein
MSLIILSRTVVSQEETMKSLLVASFRANLRFTIYENCLDIEYKSIEVYIDKNYGKETVEFMFFNIHSEEWVKKQVTEGLQENRINGESYFSIAGTDNAYSPELMYYFSLEYLRINPLHYISIYDKTIFSFNDFENIEKEGGYYLDWTAKKNRNIPC